MSNSLRPRGLDSPCLNYPGHNTGVGSLSLLQGIVPAQGSNTDLPHYGWTFHQLSRKRSPRLPDWVAYPFSDRIFPTQELKWGLLRCRWILYQLSYQGSPIGLYLLLIEDVGNSPITFRELKCCFILDCYQIQCFIPNYFPK